MAIGIFGGTFDPVHKAHIQMAVEAKQLLNLEQVILIPCHRPPHRDAPVLSSEQRLYLLQLAVEPYQGLSVDGRELLRDKPSYTVDTLRSLRQELGAGESIVLLMGMDAFYHLDQWYQWQELRSLSHIAVMSRPQAGQPSDGVLSEWLSAKTPTSCLHKQAAGAVVKIEPTQLDISATAIRQQIASGEVSGDIPAVVANYIDTLKEKRKQ